MSGWCNVAKILPKVGDVTSIVDESGFTFMAQYIGHEWRVLYADTEGVEPGKITHWFYLDHFPPWYDDEDESR